MQAGSGWPRHHPRNRCQQPSGDWLVGSGELVELIRSIDWSTTPLGPRDGWPQSLRTMINLIGATQVAMCLAWGPELLLLYNDAYRRIAAERHPGALGRPMREVWPEIWPELEPLLAAVIERGESFAFENRPFRLERGGAAEIAYFTLVYSPFLVEDGGIGGVFATLTETTASVESGQHLRESEEKFSKAFQSSCVGLLVSQFPDGRILQVNAGFTVALGYSPEEAIGRTTRELGFWADLDQRAELLRELEHGQPVESRETRFRRKDGREISCLLSVGLVTIGGTRCIVSSFVDITERKRAEQTLREQQQMIGAIVESSRDWIWAMDLDGRHTYSNHALEKILGYSPDQPQSVGLELLHPEDRQVVEARWPIWLESRQGWENLVLRWRAKDGSYRYLESTAVPTFGPRGEHLGYCGVDRDVTERKRIEESLRESEARFRALSDLSTEGIMIHAKGVVLDLNRAFAEMAGCPVEELVGKQGFEAIPFTPESRRLVQQHSEAGSVEVYEIELITEDGSRKYAETQGRYVEYRGTMARLVSMRDITDRKRAELALRTSETQLRATVENAPYVAVQWYDEEGHVLYWNRASELIFGWKRAEALGKTLDALILSPDDTQEFLRNLTRVRETCNPIGPYELQVHGRDGMSAWVLSTIFGIPLGDGRTGFVCMDVDITERRRAEEALREVDRRKTEFLAMLSHELRNPLTPICNALYILGHAAPGGEQARSAKAIMDRQIAHLIRLVDDLLDMTRITHGTIELKRERLDLNELVRRTVEDHRGVFATNGLDVTVTLAPAGLWVDGDRTRLAQAIANLLQNAAKFTPRDGSVAVSLELDASRPEAVVAVRDTGIGIAPEMMPRLFGTFAQADNTLDRSKGGLGLGLAVVKSLIEMHRGSVSAASDGVGGGAVFTIRLPLDTTRDETRADLAGIGGAGAPRRVLVIEDNEDAADSLRRALELNGHVVVVAHDGPTGIERARTLRPEVVLCDIGLPGTDGYEVARRVRGDPELGTITLVALTGYARPEDVAKARQAGFDAHLPKPPSMEALKQVLAGGVIEKLGDGERR